MSKQIELSKSAVRNIFQLRADGMSYLAIAERYPCSDHYIRGIIKRENYPEVEVPIELVMSARTAKSKWRKKKKAPVIKPPTNGVDFSPLARLMEAQVALVGAYKECVRHKISKAFIDLAIEEAGEIKR